MSEVGSETKEFTLNKRLTALVANSIRADIEHRYAVRKDLMPKDVQRLFLRAFEALDDDSRQQYSDLAVQFDRELPLFGTRGIPQLPFTINPEIFELAKRDEFGNLISELKDSAGEEIHEITVGQVGLLYVQFPLLFYRMRVINDLKLHDAILYGDDANTSTSTDSLVEYAGYLHAVTKIRSAVQEPQVGPRRRSALEALAGALKQKPGYEALSELIDFSLSDFSDFGRRQALARAAAGSPIYGDDALSNDMETICDAQVFTKRLIKEVGGLYPEDKVNLQNEIEISIENAKDDAEALMHVVLRLANDEDLELSPIAPLRPMNFHEWLAGLSRKDRWNVFKTFDQEQKINLLQLVAEAYNLRDRLLLLPESDNSSFSNFDGKILAVFPEGSRNHFAVGMLISELSQLTEQIEERGISQQLIVDLSSLVEFFRTADSLINSRQLDQTGLKAALDQCLSSRATDTPVNLRLSRGEEIRALVERLHDKDANSDFSDVINVLRISSGSESNLATGQLPAPRASGDALPSTIKEWILYVWSQKHTHSLSALIDGESEQQIEDNVRLHMRLMYAALPLYSLCDTLLDWPPWLDQLGEQDALMAQAMLIAFEARPDRLTHCLSEVMREIKDESSIWHTVFTSTRLQGLTDSHQANIINQREEFLRRLDQLSQDGLISVS